MLERFLQKFGIKKQTPSSSFLSQLYACFLEFPYENISKILKLADGCEGEKRLRLPEEVWENFLQHHMGGTCFSLTSFFKKILDDAGFTTYIIMADRSYGANTHCALVVLLDYKMILVDPAFLLPQPVEFGSDYFLPGQIWSYEFSLVRSPDQRDQYRTLRGTILTRPEFDAGKNNPIVGSEGPSFFRDKKSIQFHTVKSHQKQWRCTYKNWPIPQGDFFEHWAQSFGWHSLSSLVLTQIVGDKQIYIRDNHCRLSQPGGSVVKKTIDLNQWQSLQHPFQIPTHFIQRARDFIHSTPPSTTQKPKM